MTAGKRADDGSRTRDLRLSRPAACGSDRGITSCVGRSAGPTPVCWAAACCSAFSRICNWAARYTGAAMIDAIFRIGEAVRYVAIYRDGVLEMRSRHGTAGASSSESDRYEELLVNPT